METNNDFLIEPRNHEKEVGYLLYSTNTYIEMSMYHSKKPHLGLDMLTYTCNPSYLGGRDRRIMV
jgi:hypothetical protein